MKVSSKLALTFSNAASTFASSRSADEYVDGEDMIRRVDDDSPYYDVV